MAEPRRMEVSGRPPMPVVRRIGRSIAQIAAADYSEDHARLAKIAEDMTDVGAHQLAQEFRGFAFIALRASRAEVRP